MRRQHGYGIVRRIEQTSDNMLSINQGRLYPVLLKLEQEGAFASEWGESENNRRAKFYRISKAGQKQLIAEVTKWAQERVLKSRMLLYFSCHSLAPSAPTRRSTLECGAKTLSLLQEFLGDACIFSITSHQTP